MVKDEERNITACDAVVGKRLQGSRNEGQESEKTAVVKKIVNGIAHEIRNPLSIILQGASLIEFLSGDDNKESNETIVEMIKNSVKRINDIVNRLIEYSKSPNLEMSLQNVCECIDNVIFLLTEQFAIRNIKVEKNYIQESIFIIGNKDNSTQVFYNLAMNAIDAMPRGGSLVIKVYKEGNYCVVEFGDIGIGISQEDIPKIFEPFYTTKPSAERIGLGLAIVQQIIESYKGTISVESVPKEGTNFVIKLPIAK